jgi:hypothetical protein
VTNPFTEIAREILKIRERSERKQAALNVSKMRGFSDHYTLQRFLALCDAG